MSLWLHLYSQTSFRFSPALKMEIEIQSYWTMAFLLWSESYDLLSLSEKKSHRDLQKGRMHAITYCSCSATCRKKHKQLPFQCPFCRTTAQKRQACQISVLSVTGSVAVLHWRTQKKKKTPQGQRLIVACCFLCGTISRCHAECCQPHSPFEPPNKRACKLLFLCFWLELKRAVVGSCEMSTCSKIMYENVITCFVRSWYKITL